MGVKTNKFDGGEFVTPIDQFKPQRVFSIYFSDPIIYTLEDGSKFLEHELESSDCNKTLDWLPAARARAKANGRHLRIIYGNPPEKIRGERADILIIDEANFMGGAN